MTVLTTKIRHLSHPPLELEYGYLLYGVSTETQAVKKARAEKHQSLSTCNTESQKWRIFPRWESACWRLLQVLPPSLRLSPARGATL